MVSIVIPAYNCERFVAEAVSSALGQKYPYFELLVIDDGSRDSTPLILEEMARIHGFLFVARENRGVSATLNELLDLASGSMVVPLASDDVLYEHALEVLVGEAHKYGGRYSVINADCRFIDDEGQSISWQGADTNFALRERQRPALADDKYFGSYESFVCGNYLALPMLWNRERFLEEGGFCRELMTEDWDMWLRISKKGGIHRCRSVLAAYRIHLASASRDPALRCRMLEEVSTILRREREYCLSEGLGSVWRRTASRHAVESLEQGCVKPFVALLNRSVPSYVLSRIGPFLTKRFGA